jgi:hypothetical protein
MTYSGSWNGPWNSSSRRPSLNQAGSQNADRSSIDQSMTIDVAQSADANVMTPSFSSGS